MSQTDYKPILDAAMQACNCLTARCLIERITDTYGLPKRATVTDAMKDDIRLSTIMGESAASIARRLCVSTPTVISQRRVLGLTQKRKRKRRIPLTTPPSPAMLSGVEAGTATEPPPP